MKVMTDRRCCLCQKRLEVHLLNGLICCCNCAFPYKKKEKLERIVSAKEMGKLRSLWKVDKPQFEIEMNKLKSGMCKINLSFRDFVIMIIG